jgi:hypothetical protein
MGSATDWSADRNAPAELRPISAGVEGFSMREKLAAIRDTMIVLGLQIVFRIVMVLRRWNY